MALEMTISVSWSITTLIYTVQRQTFMIPKRMNPTDLITWMVCVIIYSIVQCRNKLKTYLSVLAFCTVFTALKFVSFCFLAEVRIVMNFKYLFMDHFFHIWTFLSLQIQVPFFWNSILPLRKDWKKLEKNPSADMRTDSEGLLLLRLTYTLSPRPNLHLAETVSDSMNPSKWCE